ncbi:hypothetical protein C8J57DRAFT_1729108 [Mycena rebaudengoi]|nr:hypothetical protein C8J57DRAFT_1729108 [Mycena rebaudengoi]
MVKMLLQPPQRTPAELPVLTSTALPPARWHEHRLILRIALSLGPNAPFTAEWGRVCWSEGTPLAAEVRQRRDVAYEDVLVMLVTKAADLEGPLRMGEDLVAEQEMVEETMVGTGVQEVQRLWRRVGRSGAGCMLDERVAVFEDPQDEYLPVVQRRRSGSGGESELGNYIVDVFVDVLLTAGFRGGRELPAVAERSPRRSRCWCARRRVHTVGKAPETREAAAQAGRGAIAEKIAVLLPRLQGTRGSGEVVPSHAPQVPSHVPQGLVHTHVPSHTLPQLAPLAQAPMPRRAVFANAGPPGVSGYVYVY